MTLINQGQDLLCKNPQIHVNVAYNLSRDRMLEVQIFKALPAAIKFIV